MPKRDFASAKRVAFQLLKFRNRSEFEIADRLKRKGFSQDLIEKTIDFLKRLKFINDEEFALIYAKSRLEKPLGLRRISFDLREKGVSQEIIEETLVNLKQGYRESEIVEKIARDKFKKINSIEKYKAKSRVYAFLVRRGFNPDVIKEVFDNL